MNVTHSPLTTSTESVSQSSGDRTVAVTVRYFAGAKAAAGTESEVINVPDAATVENLVQVLSSQHGLLLARVLSCSSLLLNSQTVRDRTVPLLANDTIEVLPPFAGG
jgi:molybdopterin converting factor small subunit